MPVKIDGFVLNHHTPDPSEVRKVIDAAHGEARLAIELLAITGARVSEVANLRRCDIEVDGKRVHLRLSGKTGTRRFPLPEPIAETMRLRAGSEATSAFPSFGSPKDQALRSRLARACKRAKVKVFTPHGLRRMVVDRMLRAGVDPATAASLTGHSVVVMLRFYRQVTGSGPGGGGGEGGAGHAGVADPSFARVYFAVATRSGQSAGIPSTCR